MSVAQAIAHAIERGLVDFDGDPIARSIEHRWAISALDSDGERALMGPSSFCDLHWPGDEPAILTFGTREDARASCKLLRKDRRSPRAVRVRVTVEVLP